MFQYQTIYFKKPLKYHKDAPSPNHSVVLSSLPSGELVCLDRLSDYVLANKDNELVRSKREVQVLLGDLIKEKMVGEVHSERLWKFLKDY